MVHKFFGSPILRIGRRLSLQPKDSASASEEDEVVVDEEDDEEEDEVGSRRPWEGIDGVITPTS